MQRNACSFSKNATVEREFINLVRRGKETLEENIALRITTGAERRGMRRRGCSLVKVFHRAVAGNGPPTHAHHVERPRFEVAIVERQGGRRRRRRGGRRRRRSRSRGGRGNGHGNAIENLIGVEVSQAAVGELNGRDGAIGDEREAVMVELDRVRIAGVTHRRHNRLIESCRISEHLNLKLQIRTVSGRAEYAGIEYDGVRLVYRCEKSLRDTVTLGIGAGAKSGTMRA